MKRWLCVLMAVAACKSRVAGHRGPLHEKEVPDGVAAPDDAAFVIGKPVVSRVPLPGRFAGPLPATGDELASATPPAAYVQQALANNTGGMRERLLVAAKRVHAPIPKNVMAWYRDALGYSVDGATCKWLVASIDKVPGDGRELLWSIVERCRDSSMADALDRDDAPASTVVSWYFDQFDADLPFRTRVAKAASELAKTSTDNFELRKIGFVFAHMTGDEPVEAMKALQAGISDPQKRATVGLGMLQSKSPAGKAIGAQSCKLPAVAQDPMCKQDEGVYTNQKKQRPPATIEEMLESGESQETLLARFGKARLLAALDKCARTGKTYQRVACLDDLVALDRATAVGVAASLQSDEDEHIARTARALVKFPEPGALEKELVRLGFVLEPVQHRPTVNTPVTAERVLAARGKVDAFDVETGMCPNAHDELLGRLAALAKPVLDDVVFEEVAPSCDNDDEPYTLHAYTHGRRYALVAENNGDWYDVNAVLGLLNALLVARGSDTRMVMLPTGDQTAIVLAAPKRALLAASKSGLIVFAGAADAEKVGKEFEDRVFNELSKEGKDVQRDVQFAPVDD